MVENSPPREPSGVSGVAGISALEDEGAPGDVALSQPEESDWKGDGRVRLGRSPKLNREGCACNSSSEEEYSNENVREVITRNVGLQSMKIFSV